MVDGPGQEFRGEGEDRVRVSPPVSRQVRRCVRQQDPRKTQGSQASHTVTSCVTCGVVLDERDEGRSIDLSLAAGPGRGGGRASVNVEGSRRRQLCSLVGKREGTENVSIAWICLGHEELTVQVRRSRRHHALPHRRWLRSNDPRNTRRVL